MGRKKPPKIDIDPFYCRPASSRRTTSSSLNPFYGYPAELIAEWCGVSVGTAEHYKAGRRPAPLPTLRLFRLYRDQKVLGDVWEDYRVIEDKIYGPDGRFITPNHIALWGLALQALADEAPEKYHEILRIAANS